MLCYFGKRSFGMMEDGHDDLLLQTVNRNQREEIDLDEGLDHILSQSLDMFEEKKILDDPIDITDMFESGGSSLVMVRIFPAGWTDEFPK